MQNIFGGWHLLAVLFIILLIWGGPKLPGLARSLGQSMNIFKTEVRAGKKTDGETDAPSVDGDASTKN